MKRFLLILPFIFIKPSYASLSQTELEDLLLNSIYSELYNRVEKIPQTETESNKRTSPNAGKRGALLVAQMKEANRIKLAKMRGIDPNLAKSGSDLVKLQKADNKKFIVHMKEVKKELEELKNRSLTSDEWKAKFKELKDDWESKKQEYIKNIKVYQNNTIDLPLVLPVDKKEQVKKTKIVLEKEYHFVEDGLSVDIKDQGNRPTCSAFSGIRAIEIALNQKGKKLDLSEQYFYWASKPKCQKSPCTNRGSWVGFGLEHSKLSGSFDIPKEEQCQYNDNSIANNETQIPLSSGCQKGIVKVSGFSYLKNLDEVLTSLKKNKPVIASIKLTPNFYQNNGLILSSESLIGPKMDYHSQGHSLILTGVVKLPKSLNEGSYCFIASNSWGLGWAVGGHSCISEKWFLENRQSNPFVTVTDIKVN